MKSFWGLTFVALLASSESLAYIKAKISKTAKPTSQHILVSGAGGELGSMFLDTALGKALRILETDPNAEVVVYNNISTKAELETEKIERAGLFITVNNNHNFGLNNLVDETQYGLPISSLHIFSHSAITYGIHFYKGGRFSHTNPLWSKLRGRFTSSGYINLAGCNTGFYLAPTLASSIGVPVSGTLTSTEFQYMDGRGQWRYANPISDLYGPGVSTNNLSYENPTSCRQGACIRMMPLYQAYSGYWGNYKYGSFPTYKFFCGNTPQNACEKTMALSLRHNLLDVAVNSSTNYAAFKRAVQGFMCPKFNSTEEQQRCLNSLSQINESSPSTTFSPTRGTTLACDGKQCYFNFECERASLFNSDQKCTLTKSEYPTTSFVDEYQRYLRGFLLL